MKTGNRKPETGIRCIRVAETMPKNISADVIARQLIRAATSVGANYRAAVRGRSSAEFAAKLGIVEEECDEALYWLDALTELLGHEGRLGELQQAGNEILAIVIASMKTARRNGK